MDAASHPSVTARWRSSNTSLQYCYNSPRLLQLTYVKYIQPKVSKAAENATATHCHVLCYRLQDSRTPLLCCGHYTGFQSLSVKQTQCRPLTMSRKHQCHHIFTICLAIGAHHHQCHNGHQVNRWLNFVDVELVWPSCFQCWCRRKQEQTSDWYSVSRYQFNFLKSIENILIWYCF